MKPRLTADAGRDFVLRTAMACLQRSVADIVNAVRSRTTFKAWAIMR
jgi:hypothetical protein